MSALTVKMRHGSSGARVDIHPNHVIKTGSDVVGERVVAQANWIDRHQCSVLPIVYDIMLSGYIMEKLDEIEPGSLFVADLDAIIGRLARDIWSRPEVTTFSPILHMEKVSKLEQYASHSMLIFLNDARDAAFDRRQRACLTHGDPTLDNVMRRMGLYVITDPIPATHAVPDLWAVDLGKILQSLVGFEQARYGHSQHNAFEVKPQHLLDTLQREDQVRAVYWCVIHILRAMPYVDEKIHDKLRECAHNAISLI